VVKIGGDNEDLFLRKTNDEKKKQIHAKKKDYIYEFDLH